jgi:hypothetical protein
MALTSTLDAVNEKLAKTLGLMKEIEKSQEKINSGAAEVLKGTVGSSQGVGGGKQVADASFGKSKKKSKDAGDGNAMSGSLGNVPAAGGTGGGTGGSTKSSSSSSSSSSTTRTTEKSGTFSDIMAGSLAAFGAAAAGAYQGTPGVADAAAYKASTFLPAFTMAGKFNSKATDKRIFDAIGQGASGVFDAQGAASIAAASGFGFNMGKTLDNMLTASSFGYQMTGMSNQSAMKGQVALHQGTSGVSSKLAKIGIFTVGSNGKPKDMGEIVDDLWARFYGSKSAKISAEKFEADLAMGFLGADLAAGFGDQPELYTQIIALMRVKVKEGGRAGIRAGVATGKNSATEMAKKHGMTEYNTPTVASGMANSARSKNIAAGTEAGLMNAFVNSAYIIEDFNNAMVSLTETLGPVAGILYNMKGLQQGVGGSEVGQVVSSVVGAVTSGLKMFLAPGGAVTGPGTSTSDSIPAMLSKDEFVVNARAASIIGRDNLNAMNALGHDFGSAFASPTRHLATGGQAIVDYASQFVGKVDYIDSADTRAAGKVPNPENGWDCSTFTQYVLKKFGVNNAPGLSDGYLNFGTEVGTWKKGTFSISEAQAKGVQAGDLLVFDSEGGNPGPAGHVGFYGGNNDIIEAAGTGKGTRRASLSGWYTDRLVAIRRASGNTLSAPSGATLGDASTDGAGNTNILSGAPDNGARYKRDSKNLYKMASVGADLGLGVGSNSRKRDTAGMPSYMSSPSGGTPSGKTPAGTTGPVNVVVDNSLDQSGFASAILRGIGAPTSGVSLEAMMTWMRYEGGHWNNRFKYNPLNTSQNVSGDDDNDPLGKSHINSYDNWQEGVDATLANLRGVGGKYKPIINALVAGKSKADIYKAIEASPWGTHNLPSASHGLDLQMSKGGLVQTHQNELIFPAEPAQDLRIALREFVSHARKDSQPITINLKIDKASDEEAERFAKKVIKIVENNGRMDRLRSR